PLEGIFEGLAQRLARFRLHFLFALSRPQMIERAVGANAVQPCPKRRPAVELADLLPGFQKRFLNDVLGVDLVSRHTKSQPVDSTAIALHKQSESVAISAASPADGDFVALIHPAIRLDFGGPCRLVQNKTGQAFPPAP